MLLLSLALTGCGDVAGGAKAGSKGGSSASPASTDLPTGLASCLPTGIPSDLPTEIPTELPTEIPSDLPTEIPSDLASCLPSGIPSDLPTEIPSDLPTGLPSDLPTDVPTVVPSGASGGPLDACTVVTPDLITGALGAASSGQALPQASSYGDPNAKDCYYFGGDATVVVQATTRADAGHAGEHLHLRGRARCGTGPGRGSRLGVLGVRPGLDHRWRDPGQGPERHQLLDHHQAEPSPCTICRSSRERPGGM